MTISFNALTTYRGIKRETLLDIEIILYIIRLINQCHLD